jgi:hypothetical protein
MPGLFPSPLYLNKTERIELEKLVKKHSTPQQIVLRARIILLADEMTGVQALERKAPDLPLAPGKVQRREFEYIRHCTQALIVNPEATGLLPGH